MIKNRHYRILGVNKKSYFEVDMSAKTNVMRILDAKKVKYKIHEYESDRNLTGNDIAQILKIDPTHVFKTLVTQGKTGNHYVFVLPVTHSLNLKKAANSVGEKNIEMVKDKDLLALTGYVHGGCSPIGMKKFFKTVFDNHAMELNPIFISAGKLGRQVELNIEDIQSVIDINFDDIAEERL